MIRESIIQQRAVLDRLLTAHEGLDKARGALHNVDTAVESLLKVSAAEAHDVWTRRVDILEAELTNLRAEENGEPTCIQST